MMMEMMDEKEDDFERCLVFVNAKMDDLFVIFAAVVNLW